MHLFNLIFLINFLFFLFNSTLIYADNLLGKNLLNNPGAELGIQDWEVNTETYSVRNDLPLPHSGNSYFFAGAYKGEAIASQKINLDNFSSLIENSEAKCIIEGYMRNYQGAEGDISQIVINFLSEDDSIIKTVKSDKISTSEYWVHYKKEVLIPQSALSVEFNLVSIYRQGASNNDGYFDDLSFIVESITSKDWIKIEHSLTTNNINAVWGSSENDIFAVGDSGTILHFDGNSWSKMDIQSSAYSNFTSVWGISNNDVYAVGTAEATRNVQIGNLFGQQVVFLGKIIHFDGNSWSEIKRFDGKQLTSIYGRSSTDIYVTGYSRLYYFPTAPKKGVIYKKIGDDWEEMNMKEPADAIYDIWTHPNENFGYVVGKELVYRLVYQYVSPSGWYKLDGNEDVTIYSLTGFNYNNNTIIVGNNGFIKSYKINDNTENIFQSCTTNKLNDIIEVDSKYLLFVGDNGIIGYPNLDNNTCKLMSTEITNDLNAIWGNSKIVIAVGDNGTILRKNDNSPIISLKPLTSSGWNHAIALKLDGSVWAWGSNSNCQLGNNSTNKVLYPTKIVHSDVVEINSSSYHSVILKSDGSVWTWGDNENFQTGIETTTSPYRICEPTECTRCSNNDISSVSTGLRTSFAIENGNVWAWGSNNFGRLGISETTNIDYLTPQKVKNDNNDYLDNILDVNAMDAILALKNDGTIWAWGRNICGTIGDTTRENRYSPVQVYGGEAGTDFLSNIIAIASGRRHSLALRKDGTVWSWGIIEYPDDKHAEVSSCSNYKKSPIQIKNGDKPLSNICSISAWGQQSYALQDNGDVWVWGSNYQGQLGIGQSPLIISAISEPEKMHINDIISIEPGYFHVLAIKKDGSLWYTGAWNEKETPTLEPDQVKLENEQEFNLFQIKEDTSTIPIRFIVGDMESDYNDLHVNASSSNSNFIVSVEGDGRNRSAIVTPKPDIFGETWIYLNVNDGKYTSSTSFKLEVVPVNDRPSFTLIKSSIVENLNCELNIIEGFATNISAGPQNENHQELEFIVTNNNNTIFHSDGQPRMNLEGDLEFISNSVGKATVYIQLKDNGGTEYGGNNLSITRIVSIDIKDNSPPEINASTLYNSFKTNLRNINVSILGTDNTKCNKNNIASFLISEFNSPSSSFTDIDELTFKKYTYEIDINDVYEPDTVIETQNGEIAVFKTYKILSENDGKKAIYAWMKDKSGNISNYSRFYVTLDTKRPELYFNDFTCQTNDEEENYYNLSPIIINASDETSGISKVALQVTNGIQYITIDNAVSFSESWIETDCISTDCINIGKWKKDEIILNFNNITVRAKAIDSAGNENIITQKINCRKNAIITCKLSVNEIKIGQDLLVSGGLFDNNHQIISENLPVQLFICHSDSGMCFNQQTTTNINGIFEHTFNCNTINKSGNWEIYSILGENDLYQTSESEHSTFLVQKTESFISIKIDNNETYIYKRLINDNINVSGQIFLSSPCFDLTAENITMNLTSPSNISFSINCSLNANGLYECQSYTVNEIGTWKIQSVFSGNQSYSSCESKIRTIDVVNTSGYAIIFYGDSYSMENNDSYVKTSKFVYEQLLQHGFEEDNISYINKKTKLEYALTQWAPSKMNTNEGDLYLFMIGKGSYKTINRVEKGIFHAYPYTITSSEINSWFNVCENKTDLTQKIISFFSFSYSGIFISELSKEKRIIITSTEADEIICKGPIEKDGIRHSDYFIYEFFKTLWTGKNIKESFYKTIEKTEFLYDQNPLLDDNGDKKGTNRLRPYYVNEEDGILSQNTIINPKPGIYPSIDEVTKTIFLNSDEVSSYSLWAKISIPDNFKLETLWIEILSPQSIELKSNDSKEYSLIQLYYCDDTLGDSCLNQGKYIWSKELLWNQFELFGTYKIFYYASFSNVNSEKKNLITLMRYSVVYKNKVANNPPSDFELLIPKSDEIVYPEIINGEDWIYFWWGESFDQDEDAVSYTLEITATNISNNEKIVFKQENIQNNYMNFNLYEKLGPNYQNFSNFETNITSYDSFGLNSNNNKTTFIYGLISKPANCLLLHLQIKNNSLNYISSPTIDFTCKEGISISPTIYGFFIILNQIENKYFFKITANNYLSKSFTYERLNSCTKASQIITLELTTVQEIKSYLVHLLELFTLVKNGTENTSHNLRLSNIKNIKNIIKEMRQFDNKPKIKLEDIIYCLQLIIPTSEE